MLSKELVKSTSMVDGLPQLKKQLAAKHAALEQLKRRMATQESSHLFRGRLVELARTSGCRVRRTRVGSVETRPWSKVSSALNTASNPSKDPTKFYLHVRPLTVVLTGRLPQTREFIKRLLGCETFVHVRQLSLMPADREGKEAVLEMEVLLFDLAEAGPVGDVVSVQR